MNFSKNWSSTFAWRSSRDQRNPLLPRHFKQSAFTALEKPGKGQIQNLTEGVQNLVRDTVTIGSLDCYLNQRGDDFEITDIVIATDLIDTLQQYMKTLGQDAALDLDQVITNSLMGDATTALKAKALGLGAAQTTLFNSNNTYGVATAPYFERFGGLANTGNSATDFASFNALPAAQSKFTRLEHLRALTQLRSNDVKPPDGKAFPVVVAPQVKFDIRQDTTLVAAMTQRDNQKLYKYEEFELDGGAFVESTNPWQEAAVYGTYNAAGGNFTSLYIGDDAVGTVKLSTNVAGGIPLPRKSPCWTNPTRATATIRLWLAHGRCSTARS